MKRILTLTLVFAALMSWTSCDRREQQEEKKISYEFPDWDGQKRAGITYQLLVYSFADSNGDGIGDFNGITSKLDYLDNLGVSALWLSPIHPADSYHGYDVTDYASVNPEYGTEADFKNLVEKAHAKDIKIYLDFVLNHTGKGHSWFKSAIASADSPYRNYYLISTNPSADISAGKFPSLGSYNANNWHSVSTGNLGYKGRLHFKLDWTNSTSPKVTVTTTTAAPESSNSDGSVQRYIYFGNDKLYRLYQTSPNIYEITVDFDSDWGFLVRTSSTSWASGTKWGGSGSKISFGTPFTLNSSTAADITFGGSSVYYYGAFGSWMPDIAYGEAASAEQSPAFKDLTAAADKWINIGIDGLRLDAVRFIYEKGAPDANSTFLKKWYDHCNATYKAKGGSGDFYMVGEAWMDNADQMAPYYKGLPALFEFDFWFRLQWCLQQETGCYFVKDLLSYQDIYRKYRSDFIECTKLSNHDEDRTAHTLGRNLPRMKQAAAILLTAGGNPYIYQGEELGYYGSKSGGDEYVRAPMVWNSSASGLASAKLGGKVDAGMLNGSISVETQESQSNSILKVYEYFTKLRNAVPALAYGKMSKHSNYNETGSDSYKSLAVWYMTTSDGQKALVVHNLAGTQVVAPFSDDLTNMVGYLGMVSVTKSDSGNSYKLILEGNSSAVFAL